MTEDAAESAPPGFMSTWALRTSGQFCGPQFNRALADKPFQ